VASAFLWATDAGSISTGGELMKTYQVNLTATSNYLAKIKANSLKEAWEKVNQLNINDYQMLDGNPDLVEVKEIV